MSALLGAAGIIYALYYVFHAPHEGFTGYFDQPAMILIGIAPPAIILLSHSLGDLFLGLRLVVEGFFRSKRRTQNEVINSMSQLAAMVRAEGHGALLQARRAIRYPNLRDGISMIVNDFSSDEIRHNLEAKIDAKQSRMRHASEMFENMAKISPGVGMIGTLIGLISMMSRMSDPQGIGSGMALALITTLYGLVLGTVVYQPLAERIAVEGEKQLEIDQLVLEGVLHIKNRKSSLHFNDLVSTYSSKGSSAQAQAAAPSGKPR